MGRGLELRERGPALAEPKWYAVLTRARAESEAVASLERAGYWTFFPFDRVRKSRRMSNGNRRIEWRVSPYFSRYVFVALRYEGETLDQVQPINPRTGFGMEGVATVVRSKITGEPFRIPGREMDRICDRAMVRLGDEDLWLQALMREIQLDEMTKTTISINPRGRRQIVTEPRQDIKLAS